jgi:hypothetical protein
MRIKLIRSYRKLNKNGQPTTVFVYAVAGTEDQLSAYKAAQGSNYRESDDGEPLWFSTRCVGNAGKLITTSKGGFAPDMSAFDQAASLATQYGGNLGQELARKAAESLFVCSTASAEAVPSEKAGANLSKA